MALKLTIDEGNTSTKAALWDGDTIVGQQTFADGATPEFPDASEVIVSSVRRPSEAIEHIPANVKPAILSCDTPLPVTICYATPHTLGSDRIAAAAGAAAVAPGRNVLIADIGTAATYDFVTADRCFEGGNIAPGVEMRLNALHNYTAALPAVISDGPAPLIGKTTEEAMRSGAIRGIAAEIEYYFNRFRDLTSEPVIILTGGSAETVAGYISSPFIIEPDLVMIGLKSILDYNENN